MRRGFFVEAKINTPLTPRLRFPAMLDTLLGLTHGSAAERGPFGREAREPCVSPNFIVRPSLTALSLPKGNDV